METKCKNCMCFSQAYSVGSGEKGTCGQTGDLVVHHRDDDCVCGRFMELPKKEKIIRTINKVLKAWVRERDAMFVRSMEIVAHINQLFEDGEFKVFDAVKASSEMKGLVFFGKDTFHKIDRVWTYHCPWDEEKEHFIAFSASGKMVMNNWDNDKKEFVTEWFDTDTQFNECMAAIDKIRLNCVTKARVAEIIIESEQNKCVSDESTTIADFSAPSVCPFDVIRYPR